MKHLLAILILISLHGITAAQKDTTGTITVKKKLQKKTLFDQAHSRIVLIDQYGKVLDSSQVVSFDMVLAVKEKMYTYSTTGAYLDHQMKDEMMLAPEGTIIYLKNIKAKNKKGEIESYPGTVIKVSEKLD